MKTCPPEIHSYIFALACTDDGRTVRALSLVSKYFREIVRPYLFQSLSVSGVDQILTLATKLEGTSPHHRQIRHLFISDESLRKTDHELGRHICNLEADTIIRILNLAAPTLETLAFVTACPSTSSSLIARLFRISFPRLQELSISGFYPFMSFPGKMPALERLHLSGNRNPHGLLQLGSLADCTPGLTHVRISGLCMALSFASELEAAVKGENLCMLSSQLPPKIQHILVQPGPPPLTTGKPGAAHLKDDMMMKRLEGIKGDTDSVRITLLERSEREMSPNLLRRCWLDRLTGGEGLWVG